MHIFNLLNLNYEIPIYNYNVVSAELSLYFM